MKIAVGSWIDMVSLDDGCVVWNSDDGSDWEIFCWNGGPIWQLSDEALGQDVGVHLGRHDVGVAEEPLHLPQVATGLEQQRRRSMPQEVRRDALLYALSFPKTHVKTEFLHQSTRTDGHVGTIGSTWDMTARPRNAPDTSFREAQPGGLTAGQYLRRQAARRVDAGRLLLARPPDRCDSLGWICRQVFRTWAD